MNREQAIEVLTIFIFALLAIWIFQIHPFLVILAMCATFFYILRRNDMELAKKIQFESNQLTNQIKTTSSDAYLKQKQLYTLVANLPFPLVLLDVDGNIVLYNKQFEIFRQDEKTSGLTYSKNDFEKNVYRFVNDAYIFEREIDKAMNVNGIEYEAISVPITANDAFSGCIILFQDISKIKEKEQMQKQFIADASHELKTPISAIKGMSEILNREGFDDEAIRKDFLLQIQKENNRLELIVQDLLQLSRLSVDVIVLKRATVDFTQILDRSIDSLKQKANSKGLQLRKDYQTHDKVFVDAEQMEIVVNNLVSNAIAYSDQGSICARTYKRGDYYVCEIEDEGQGIAEQDLHRVFERFYRVDTARSRQSGGSGLGLSIVVSIVEAHDAKIEIESELGKGSIFRILLKY